MFRSRGTLSLIAAVTAVASLLQVAPVSAADGVLNYMLKDIKLGAHGSKPSDLTAIGGLLYFTAADGRHGREPWISDGTTLGTRMIKNIAAGSYSSRPRDYTLVGDRVFFTAQDGMGRELWVTDGTAAGTTLVKDIRPGEQNSKPSQLTALGDALIFTANDGQTGTELWRSDGTDAGTVRVADLEPGRRGSGPTELSAYLNSVYFVANFPAEGNVDGPCCKLLYQSDGTDVGTRPVVDRNGDEILHPGNLVTSGSLLYFAGLDASWEPRLLRTDGTALGTKALSPVMHAEQLTDVAGALYFIESPKWDGDPAGLWKSDGTKAGTVFIKSVNNPSQLTASGGYLYYTTLEDDLMQPLHVSDGVARPEDSWAAANWGNGYGWGNLTDVGGTLFTTVGFNTDPEIQLGWDIQYWDCSLYDGDCTQYLWLRRAIPLLNGESAIRQVHDLTAVGSTLFFVAADLDGQAGQELGHYQIPTN